MTRRNLAPRSKERIPEVEARGLTPTPNHWRFVIDLMQAAQATGAVLSETVRAAHAIENRATLCSNDADFSRFKGLKWINPLDAL